MTNLFKKLLLLSAGVIMFTSTMAQSYYSRSAKISFYSEAPLEDIESHNYSGSSVLDLGTGQLEFAVLIKGFQFHKALMQQHFNESYMESDKFPKAIFRGSFEPGQLQKSSGKNTINVSGDITIKGISQPIELSGIISNSEKGLKGSASFEIAIADFGIKVPKVVRENIADTVLITVEVPYEAFEPK
jgi:hypothetical protein